VCPLEWDETSNLKMNLLEYEQAVAAKRSALGKQARDVLAEQRAREKHWALAVRPASPSADRSNPATSGIPSLGIKMQQAQMLKLRKQEEYRRRVKVDTGPNPQGLAPQRWARTALSSRQPRPQSSNDAPPPPSTDYLAEQAYDHSDGGLARRVGAEPGEAVKVRSQEEITREPPPTPDVSPHADERSGRASPPAIPPRSRNRLGVDDEKNRAAVPIPWLASPRIAMERSRKAVYAEQLRHQMASQEARRIRRDQDARDVSPPRRRPEQQSKTRNLVDGRSAVEGGAGVSAHFGEVYSRARKATYAEHLRQQMADEQERRKWPATRDYSEADDNSAAQGPSRASSDEMKIGSDRSRKTVYAEQLRQQMASQEARRIRRDQDARDVSPPRYTKNQGDEPVTEQGAHRTRLQVEYAVQLEAQIREKKDREERQKAQSREEARAYLEMERRQDAVLRERQQATMAKPRHPLTHDVDPSFHPSMLSHLGDAERGVVPYDHSSANARHHGGGAAAQLGLMHQIDDGNVGSAYSYDGQKGVGDRKNSDGRAAVRVVSKAAAAIDVDMAFGAMARQRQQQRDYRAVLEEQIRAKKVREQLEKEDMMHEKIEERNQSCPPHKQNYYRRDPNVQSPSRPYQLLSRHHPSLLQSQQSQRKRDGEGMSQQQQYLSPLAQLPSTPPVESSVAWDDSVTESMRDIGLVPHRAVPAHQHQQQGYQLGQPSQSPQLQDDSTDRAVALTNAVPWAGSIAKRGRGLAQLNGGAEEQEDIHRKGQQWGSVLEQQIAESKALKAAEEGRMREHERSDDARLARER
jgi:hypothetical protein